MSASALPSDRCAVYVRALRAAVYALAPDADHVPAEATDTHLHALDPAVSGPLLLPATIDTVTGLPSSSWLDRVRAERDALHQTQAIDADRIARASQADPQLAARLQGRRRLMDWLSGRSLLPDLAVGAKVLRDDGSQRVVQLTVDRRLDGAGWIRLRADVVDTRQTAGVVARMDEAGRILLRAGLGELLTRHTISPLPGVYGILTEVAGLRVRRLSRGCIGPFWFPGGSVPDHAPEWASQGLSLHQSLVVMADDVRHSHHTDPWLRLPQHGGEGLPAGFGVYRSRRFAVSPAIAEAVRSWSTARVGAAQVVVFGRR